MPNFAYSSMNFTGNGTDSGVGLSGVSDVYMAIEHTEGPDGFIGYWNWGTEAFDATIPDPGVNPSGAGWTFVSSTPLQNQTSISWSTPVPAGMLVSSNTYRVITLARDQASNRQSNLSGSGVGSSRRKNTKRRPWSFSCSAWIIREVRS